MKTPMAMPVHVALAIVALTFCPQAFAQGETPPTEFITQMLEPLGGKIERPKDWLYLERHGGAGYHWILSKEDASKGSYTTGVRIQIFAGVQARTGETPKGLIQRALAEKKKVAAKVINECPETDMGMFVRQCLELEEGSHRVLYSVFWGKNMDIAVMSVAGTLKELWPVYSATFNRMSSFELIDMKRFADKAREGAAPPLPASIKTPVDFDVFVQRYYQEPHPEMVDQAIEFAGSGSAFTQPGTIPPTMGFFTAVFSRHPDRAAEWAALIERQTDPGRAALRKAMELSANPSRLLDGKGTSPGTNDACWGLFFGSGDAQYLTRLIDTLALMEDSDLQQYAAATSAKWSLGSNAASHAAVRTAVEKARDQARDPLLKHLNDVLTVPPMELRRVMTLLLQERAGRTEFQANVMAVKGTPEAQTAWKSDPARSIEEFSVGYDEKFTVFVTYMLPKRDANKHARVTYALEIEKPDGSITPPIEGMQSIPGGEGAIPDERLGHWATSKGMLGVDFTPAEDAPGVYIYRFKIRDHVGDREIARTLKIRLQ